MLLLNTFLCTEWTLASLWRLLYSKASTRRNIPFSYPSSTCEMVKSSGWMIPIQLCERGVWNPVVAERLRHSLDIYSAVWNCFIIHVILHHHWLDLYLFTRVKFKTANDSDVWNPTQPIAAADDNTFTRMKLDVQHFFCASPLPSLHFYFKV